MHRGNQTHIHAFVLDRHIHIDRRIHFAVEEIVMRLFDYPGLEAHAAEHRAFAQRLTQLKASELNEDIHAQAGKFLREWLVEHIQGSDKLYATYLLDNGATLKRD